MTPFFKSISKSISKSATLAILTLSLVSFAPGLCGSAFAADETAPQRLKNESELGIVIAGGNSESESFNFKQLNTYAWELNSLRLTGTYLQANTQSVETTKYWGLGLRYERELSPRVGVFLGQAVEADRFAGYFQRYNTDIGAKYRIIKEEAFYWNAEAGYRYAVENQIARRITSSYLRIYTEAARSWTPTFSTKLWAEYLPNLTNTDDSQINSEISVSAALTSVFAIKTGYLVRYRNALVAPATRHTDTLFTTALVAKF